MDNTSHNKSPKNKKNNNKEKNNDDNFDKLLEKRLKPKNTMIDSMKSYIHNILDKNQKSKNHKRKSFGKVNQRIYPSSEIIKPNTNLFESLMNSEQDNNPINDPENGKQNKTFYINLKIKKKLLKDYKEDIKAEKKNRKIKKTKNLDDSLDDNEECSSDEEENIRYNFYISSDSNFIFFFDLLLMIFSLYISFSIPLSLAKRKYFCEKEEISISFIYLTEIIFIVDILITSVRSYYNYQYKKIVYSLKIIKHYLRTGAFFIDLLEAFPSFILSRKMCTNNYFDRYNSTKLELYMNILLILKSLKIFKVLDNQKNRVMEVLYENSSEYYYLEQLIKFVSYLISIFSFFHTLICLHIYLGGQSFPNWFNLIKIQNDTLWNKYISSFYFIIATMTTVGYGDIVCISPLERNFQIVLLAIGTVIYSFIITKFGNYIGKKNNIQIELSNKEQILEQIRITNPLMTFKLYYKIHNYLLKKANKQQHNKNVEINMLVNSLPDKIRNEILKTIYKNEIKNFKIFNDCKNSDFIIKMLSCFVQTTCKKDTILILEGEKIENIILVKDGHLILEATIDLKNPYKSVKKYFKDNFKDINIEEYNKNKRDSLLSKSDKEDKEEIGETEEDKEKNMQALQEKINYFLENNNKNTKNKGLTQIKDTKINLSTQIGFSENSLIDEDESFDKNEENCQFLKILDIRKNEYFGDIYMFLDRPAPLTLKVKSKKAEIFALKKRDAININKIHHNIVKRIQIKSYKNLLSIKRKTIKTLKKYYDFTRFNTIGGINLQDMSWYNEKSRNISIMDKTNISTKSNVNSQNLSLFVPKRLVKQSCINNRVKRGISKLTHINIRKSISTNSWANDEKYKKAGINSILVKKWQQKYLPKPSKFKEHTMLPNKITFLNKLNALKKSEQIQPLKTQFTKSNQNNNININIINENSIEFKPQNVSKVNLNGTIKKNTSQNFSINKSINFEVCSNKNKTSQSLAKLSIAKAKETGDYNKTYGSTKNNLSDLEITKEEEQINTLNNINSFMDKKIRKRIKSSVKKEKIVNLWKFYSEIIKSNLDFEKITDFMNKINIIDKDEININNIRNINDLNTIIFDKLIEYLSYGDFTDKGYGKENSILSSSSSESTLKIKKKKKGSFKQENIISFKINSFYYNLNSLTKGKIIESDKCKKDIKSLIKNYIKGKKRKEHKSKNRTSKLVTNSTPGKFKYMSNLNSLIYQKTKGISINDLDDISSISSNIIKESNESKESNDSMRNKSQISSKKNKKETSVPNKKNTSTIFTKKIKNSVVNNTDVYKNFRNLEIKFSKKRFDEVNQKHKFILSGIFNKNKNSISSNNLLFYKNVNENNNEKNNQSVNQYKNTEDELINK